MAYKIIRAKSNTYTSGREITAVLDTADDLYSLQVNESGMSPGSIAIVADAGLTSYVLNASGEWKSVDDDGSSGGGGGNPNTVEVIEGTVGHPFGDMTPEEFQQLCADVLEGSVTVGARITGSPEIFGTTITDDGSYALAFSYVAGEFVDGVFEVREPTASLIYGGPNSQSAAVIYNTEAGGFVNIPGSTPTIVRIIRHPLPESTTGGNA